MSILKQLQETKNIRLKRAELMRRLYSGQNGRKYTLKEIADLYGATKAYVAQELKWLKHQS